MGNLKHAASTRTLTILYALQRSIVKEYLFAELHNNHCDIIGGASFLRSKRQLLGQLLRGRPRLVSHVHDLLVLQAATAAPLHICKKAIARQYQPLVIRCKGRMWAHVRYDGMSKRS